MNKKVSFFAMMLIALGTVAAISACAPASAPVEGIQVEEADQEPEPTTESTLGPEPTVEIIPLEDLEVWDLLWISDSSGWDVADVYAAMVAEDTGKTINVQDNWIGGLPAEDIYLSLTGQYDGPSYTLEKMPELVADAEIIVFFGNPAESINPDRPGDWYCVPSVGAYVNDCDPDIFSTYIEHLEIIYTRMLELRGGQPTIIRAYDAYYPLIDQRREEGNYEECKTCWANFNAAIHQAAGNMDIPVAEVSLRWNGPDWDIDPDSELGYTKDTEHPNELGAEVIAQALRELEYEPIIP